MRYKMRIIVLALFVLLGCVLPINVADGATKPVLGASTVYTDKTGTVGIAIFIASEQKIASGSFDIMYDSNLLKIREQDITIGEVIAPTLTSLYGSEAGKVSVAWAQAEGQTLDGTVVKLSPNVLKAGQATTIRLANVKLFSEDGTEIVAEVLDGQIQPFNGKKSVHSKKEKSNKAWTITLSQDVNMATVNKHTVVVKNNKGVALDIKVDKKTNHSFTVTPVSQYPTGKYILEISDQVRSVNGNKLTQAIQYEFEIE